MQMKIKQHKSKWPHIPDHQYRINNQPDIDKLYLHAKDTYEAKIQFLINKREKTRLKHFNNPKAFMEQYSNDMQEILRNTIQVKNVKY